MEDEQLVVALEARIAEFERRMKKAERTGTRSYKNLRSGSRGATRAMERDMNRATTRINQSLASTTARIGTFSKAFIGGLAGGAVVGAFAAMTTGLRGTVAGIAQVGDEARRAGVDLQAFQEWKFVAEQNRIGIDAMVDGLKELNLRADEFVVTGKGPAAEAFARLGFGAQDLKERLKDPSELLLEIIGRMEDLDNAAQIRVADEIFGGTAGERFVELLAQGQDGLRQTVQRASEVGAVLDREVIEKAAELDRRFSELTTRVSNFFKRAAVGAVDFGAEIANISTEATELEDILRDVAQAGSLLGDGVTDSLRETDGAVDAHASTIAEILGLYEGVISEAAQMGAALQRASRDAERMGETGLSERLREIAIEMQGLQEKLDSGEASAEELEGQLVTLADEASTAVSELVKIDAVAFDGVLVGLGRLITAIGTATTRARELRASLPGAGPDGTTDTPINYGPPRRGGPRGAAGVQVQTPDGNTPRPRSAPDDIDFGLPPVASGGGNGGGGGRASVSEYTRELEDIRGKTSELILEAAELAAVADSGRDYGDAIEYARTRAELLYAAQQDGRKITPELRSEIEGLAADYVQAGMDAEEAADRMKRVEEEARRGSDALGDIFLAATDGADSAKRAVIELIAEMARIQILKSAASFGETTGLSGFIGGLLGREHGGAVRGGQPYLVNERTANSEVFVPSQNGAVLNVPQAQAALRRSVGPSGPRNETVNVTYAPQIDASGADPAAIRRLEEAIQIDRAQFSSKVVEAVTRARRSRHLQI